MFMCKFIQKDFQDKLTSIINSNFTNEHELVSFAKELNVTRMTINRWRNQVLMPNISSLARICLITNTSLDYILLNNPMGYNLNELYYNEDLFKQRFINLVNTSFKNNFEITTRFKISHVAISNWKLKNALPTLNSIIKIVLYTKNSLNKLVFTKK